MSRHRRGCRRSARGVVTALVSGLSFNFFHTVPHLSLRIDLRTEIVTVHRIAEDVA